jgi:phosphatidylethanolamine/phosphatidyl-N-methylethanolamine N-methyltransferase
MFADAVHFVRLYFRRPRSVGTLVPAGEALALAIAKQVPQPATLPVVELGGGTGAVTRALVDVGIPKDRLVVLELEESLYRILAGRFPDVRVLRADARDLSSVLRREGIERVGAVVSALPFPVMPRDTVRRIVDECLAVMAPGAPLVQYTFTWLPPIPRVHHGLEGRLVTRVFNNLPPATVWVYRRKQERPAGPTR